MRPWRQIGETETIHDGWRKVFRKKFLMNSGKEFVAEVSDKDGFIAVEVIALTPENKVIIARQFRVGPGKVMEELPGGAVEQGENPDVAIARELHEETGYEAGRITKIGEIYKNAYMQSKWYYYLAEDCRLSNIALNPDENEEIDIVLISIGQLFKNAQAGLMTDTEAVFLAYEKLKELEGGK